MRPGPRYLPFHRGGEVKLRTRKFSSYECLTGNIPLSPICVAWDIARHTTASFLVGLLQAGYRNSLKGEENATTTEK